MGDGGGALGRLPGVPVKLSVPLAALPVSTFGCALPRQGCSRLGPPQGSNLHLAAAHVEEGLLEDGEA